jgi:aldose sugar dehydrogenase
MKVRRDSRSSGATGAGRVLVMGAAASLALALPLAAQPPPPQPPARVVTVAEGLENPWGLAFLPDGDMLVTERAGRLRLVQGGRLSEPISGLPEVFVRQQGGLMDVAVHPDFAQNRLVYLSLSRGTQESATTAIVRGRLEGTSLVGVEDVFEAKAWAPGGIQFGSRMVFDRDGYLFISIGDRNVPPRLGEGPGHPAQDLASHNGTIVRLHDDGRVPQDNPFVGRPGALPEIWAYGMRNAQGLAFHPETGELWTTEHGPQGGDELNRIVRGGNYGWPVVGYGVAYGGNVIHAGSQLDGMEQPVQQFTPSPGLSGLAFYTHDGFPRWKGAAFLGAMTGQALWRVALNGTTVTQVQRVAEVTPERIRDVRVGPDQFIYFLTDSAQGRIVRLEPAP